MLNFVNLLVPTSGETSYNLYITLSRVMIVLMLVAAVAAIVLVLLQPGNSTGIDALGGSSETFFGKNKGKSIEAKMKKWTYICLAILLVFSVCFYIFAASFHLVVSINIFTSAALTKSRFFLPFYISKKGSD